MIFNSGSKLSMVFQTDFSCWSPKGFVPIRYGRATSFSTLGNLTDFDLALSIESPICFVIPYY